MGDKNKVQFVPMVWGRWIKFGVDKCQFGESGCNAQKLIKVMSGPMEKLKGQADLSG